MARKQRVLAIVLMCLVVFAVLSSVYCIAADSEHDCTGKGCSVCVQLVAAQRTLKGVLSATVMVTATAFVLICTAVLFMPPFAEVKAAGTLVSLKVKLSS